MDIQDYQLFDGEILRQKIKSLSRAELDNQIRRFGGHYALLCQRLEAFYSPDRLDRFIAIRPGGLDEIDKAIAQAGQENQKELALLKSFRELNRILQPFMDVYEERVLAELGSLSKEELDTLYANVIEQLTAAQDRQNQQTDDYRLTQNAGGTLRLATLIKSGVQEELKRRSGYENS